MNASYLGYILAYVGADLIVALVALVGAHRSIAFGWNADLRAWCQALISAIPLGAIQITNTIYSWVDSILVSVFLSAAQLGYYSISFNIVNVLLAIPGFLIQALIPSLVDADKEEVERLLNRAVYLLVCLGSLLAVGGIVLRGDIIFVIAGPGFQPAVIPLAIIAASLPVSFVQTALSYAAFVIDRYRPLLLVSLGTLATNIAANVLVIPRYGLIGAASVLLGTEGLSLVATYFVFRHLTAIRVRCGLALSPNSCRRCGLGLAAIRTPLRPDKNFLWPFCGAALWLRCFILVVGPSQGCSKRGETEST